MNNIFYRIKTWIELKLNKRHLTLVYKTFTSWPWDGRELLDIEQLKLLEMADYFEKNQFTTDDKRNAERLRLMARLIDIVQERGNFSDMYTYKLKVSKGKGSKLSPDEYGYYCIVKVNTNNLDRFAKNQNEKALYENYPHELYIRKAHKLYEKLRFQYLLEIWN